MSNWPLDQSAAHRWFAIEFNNEAWSIVEATQRSAKDVERLLHLRTPLAFTGRPSELRSIASERLASWPMLTPLPPKPTNRSSMPKWPGLFSEKHGAEQTPFDRAEALGTTSVALRAAGRREEADQWRAKALEAAASLDNDDRAVVERLLGR